MKSNVKSSMTALIKKDLQRITDNKRMFASLLVVPLVLTILLPTAFILLSYYAPQEQDDFQKLLELLPAAEQGSSMPESLTRLILNYVLPVFFLIIPIMAATIMSASSFVGEKEKQTLETLLYSPLTIRQIFQAKAAASFLLSMLVSWISFAAMLLVLEAEVYLISANFLLPGIPWLVIMLLLSPSLSLIAITLIVRISAKSQSVEDAQQGAVFLLLPILLLLISQFSGLLLINAWILLALGLVCAVLAWMLLQKAAGNFTYEMLHTLF